MDFGGGWADEDELTDDFLPEPQVIGPDEKGIKSYISYRKGDDGTKEKVIRKVKIVTKKKKVAKSIQRRKELPKFGLAHGKPPGPEEETTIISRDQVPMEAPGEELKQAKAQEEDLLRRLREGKSRRLRREAMEEKKASILGDDGSKSGGAGARSALADLASGASKEGKYVPPSLRAGGAGEKPSRFGASDDAEQNTLRVTNISEDTTEDDLRDLFRPFGGIQRVYLAKDRETQQSRGFAYISYHSRESAQRAMERLNGFGYDHLILKVEWAKPSTKDDVGSQSVMKAGIVSGYGKALPQGMGGDKK